MLMCVFELIWFCIRIASHPLDITTFGKIVLISSCIFPKPQILVDEDSWITLMCVFVVSLIWFFIRNVSHPPIYNFWKNRFDFGFWAQGSNITPCFLVAHVPPVAWKICSVHLQTGLLIFILPFSVLICPFPVS